MNDELLAVLDYLESERGINRQELLSLVEESLLSAARKAVGPANELQVRVDPRTGDIRAFAKLTVVSRITDPHSEITLTQARKRYPEVKVGETVEWEVTPSDFGRIAAQTAKNTITQRLRAAEKTLISSEYKALLNQLIAVTVVRVERGDVVVDSGRAEGIMPRQERIPHETYEPGDHLTVLLIEINSDRPGPTLRVSRARPLFVVRLFEREVSELAEGTVEVKRIAREPGHRTKMAVASNDPRVDPVGACVGLRGNRVRTIVRELGGEKVDIIPWSEDVKEMVSYALQPAKLAGVEVDESTKTIHVEVPEDQLAWAIGRGGMNVRLASELLGYRVKINRIDRPERRGFEMKVQRAIDALAQFPAIGRDAAEVLVRNGFISLEGILAAELEDLAALDGLDLERAKQIKEAARRRIEGG